MKGDGYIDFSQIANIKFEDLSPVEGDIKNLFDLRDEMTLSILDPETIEA